MTAQGANMRRHAKSLLVRAQEAVNPFEVPYDLSSTWYSNPLAAKVSMERLVCPTCKAPAGSPCQGPRKSVLKHPHPKRYEAAIELMVAERTGKPKCHTCNDSKQDEFGLPCLFCA
jgi:hypothetical protein